jgi:hypothetical protein
MDDVRWDRLGAAAGVVAVVVFVVAFAITGSPPKPSAPDKVIQAFVVDKRGALLTQAWLLCLAATLFVWFVAAVRDVLARGDTGNAPAAAVFFGAALVGIALLVVAGVVQIAVAHKTGGTVSPASARFGYDLVAASVSMNSLPFALATAMFAVAVSRSLVLPRWTAALAALAAVTMLAQTFVIWSRTGFFSLEGGYGIVPFAAIMLWTVGTCVALATRRSAVRAPG